MIKLCLTALVLVCNLCFSIEPAYDIIPLKPLEDSSYACAIVNTMSDEGYLAGRYDGKPFIYSLHQGFQVLQNVPGKFSEATFVWEHHVVGTYSLEKYAPMDEEGKVFIYDMRTRECIDLLNRPELQELGITYAYPIGIDQSGILACKITEASSFYPQEAGFFYDIPHNKIMFGFPGVFPDDEILAMNKKGQILSYFWMYDPAIGYKYLPTDSLGFTLNDEGHVIGVQNQKVFLWDTQNMVYSKPLSDDLEVDFFTANRSDHALGVVEDEDGEQRSFFFNPSAEEPLVWIKKFKKLETRLEAINDLDQAVGWASSMKELKAILWSPQNGFTDLQKTIPRDTKWSKLLFAHAINNQGWITGMGMFEEQMESFLLIPKQPQSALRTKDE